MKTKNILSYSFAIILVVSLVFTVFTGCQKNALSSQSSTALTALSAEDVSLLVKDFPPETLRQFADAEQKKELLDDLKNILALAAEARNSQIAAEPEIKEQLDFFVASTIAGEFDRANRPAESRNMPAPPFANVKPEEVEAFYKEPGVEAKYNSFLELVKKRAAAARPGAPPELTEPQLQQIRDGFAKISLTERKARAAGFDKERKTQLAIQLQQATFLAQEYSRRNEKQFDASDAEIAEYVKSHPELDPAKKRAVAEQVLQRAKTGEDFAKLAKEFSEDPGSKDKGGLYEDVKKGQFVPEFETAAFALEKGKIAEQLVESKFGYHIIKLEKKAADSFTARHILISTTAQNPANPLAPPMSMNEQAREAIKKQKRDKWLEEIVAKNNIKLPSAEEIKIEAPPAAPAAEEMPPPAPGAQTAPPVGEKEKK